MTHDEPVDRRWTPFGDLADEAPGGAVGGPLEKGEVGGLVPSPSKSATPTQPSMDSASPAEDSPRSEPPVTTPPPPVPENVIEGDQDASKGTSRGTVDEEEVRERKDRLFRRRELSATLQARGWSYRRIAKRLGLHVSTVHDDVRIYYRDAARFFDAPTYREKLGAAQWDVARQAWKELRHLEAIDSARRGLKQPPLHTAERLACLEQISKTMERLAKMFGFSGEAAVSINQFNLGGTNGDTVGRSVLEGLNPERRRAVRDKLLALQNAMLPRMALEAPLEAVEADVVEEEEAPPP